MPDIEELEQRLIEGDRAALAELFQVHYERLWRIVHFRLDPRMHGRIDADDVLQDAFIDAEKRITTVLHESPGSVFIWLRLIVNQTLTDLHRKHLMAQKRSAKKEIRVNHQKYSSESTSFALSFHLLGHLTSPSQAVLRTEISENLEAALSSLSEIDREVLALRHFEELTNSETAQILNLTPQAASVRYIRAIKHLKHVLTAIPGLMPEDA
ncbi:ECF RNA polymerase sigma factor SigW [Polystyrenella longa]|uniref:ECF RNA polymerase sigma factor SigW n=1 Tax=Polystyrenella longa TaxID=2528007 RepID=A0A518CGT1_9PLAN|nr:sigma-70 family RNA polymerase sigma factor [Polystyrenella longa]QDU78429.1 ECF RNA polymerase sigma factor SigW [Polystyrenella longa]